MEFFFLAVWINSTVQYFPGSPSFPPFQKFRNCVFRFSVFFVFVMAAMLVQRLLSLNGCATVKNSNTNSGQSFNNYCFVNKILLLVLVIVRTFYILMTDLLVYNYTDCISNKDTNCELSTWNISFSKSEWYFCQNLFFNIMV